MAVSTKNVNTNENGFIRKNLEPGNHKCTIQSIKMQKAMHIKDKEEFQIILNLEGPAIGGTFVGFLIDQADPSKGNHKGQSSLVKLSQYNYRDGETKSKIPVERDVEILKDLKRLCDELGGPCVEWYSNIDSRQFPTVEALMVAFDNEKPFAGIEMHYCLAGKKYTNKKGYAAYELFLPRKTDLGRPFCKDESKVQKYFPTIHIIETKAKELEEGFSAESSGTTQNSQTKTINTNNIETATEISDNKKDDGDVPFVL